MAKTKKSVDQTRGAFLTVLIVISALSGLLSLVSSLGGNAAFMALGISLPAWYPIYLFLLNIASFVALYGVWMLKKWGVYVLATTFVLTLLNTMVFFSSQGFSLQLGLVIIDGLWFWAIYRKWSVFTD